MNTNVTDFLQQMKLAGELAGDLLNMQVRERAMGKELDETRDENLQLRSEHQRYKSAQEQLVGIAFPFDPTRVNQSSEAHPTLQDCIGQLRRKLDQARRDRESVEHYQKVTESQKIDLVQAASAVRDARDMLLNSDATDQLRAALAARMTEVLIRLTRPG